MPRSADLDAAIEIIVVDAYGDRHLPVTGRNR
jgi:hypothetical protein